MARKPQRSKAKPSAPAPAGGTDREKIIADTAREAGVMIKELGIEQLD